MDLDHLERLLEEAILNPANRQRKKIIITETLFSMDGDAPDLKRLIKIKRKYDCVLILDEAHAFGVYGNQGRGMCFEDLTEGEIADIEYRVYTLGKSMGLEGGIIATTMVGRDHLVNRMRSFIFSTAPMPLISSTAIDSLNLVMQGDDKREHLKNISARLREGLKKVGFTLSPSISQIIPVLLSSEKEALEYSKELQSRGFDIRAIRPPTVPTARLRISLNSNITENEIDSLIFNMSEIKNKLI